MSDILSKIMLKKFIIVCCLSILSGCGGAMVGMQLEDNNRRSTTLIGDWDRQGVSNFALNVSDGELTCSGLSEKVPFILDELNWSLAYPDLRCSDGRKGTLKLNLRGNLLTARGIGIGRLNDGTKIKVILGDLSGPLDFDW